MAPQAELVRVVRTAGGGLAVGRGLPGRGAWLCVGSPRCVALARRRKAFQRSLRATIEPGALAALEAELADHGGTGSEEGT